MKILLNLFVAAAALFATLPGNTALPPLSPLETRVLGQNQLLRGAPAGLRVIVTDHQTGNPVNADVTISMGQASDSKSAVFAPIRLFSGRTNRLGTLNAQFKTPALEPGAYELILHVKSALGTDDIRQPIQLQESARILLTSDKPLYQPGQLMHIRALALDAGTRAGIADAPITFEVEDARGNKVFKLRGKLSKFGVAGADFQLADEVNMGAFTLRAILEQGQEEKKVRVERYVLPKFKLTVTADKPFYLPGETLSGKVSANYFFGKPVAGGSVKLAVNTFDIGITKLTDISGETDAQGIFKFSYKLPDSFIGQPFEQGKAVVELAASLKDTAEQRQETSLSLPVVKDPVSVVIVPEREGLVAGVLNTVYIAAATPDGNALTAAAVTVTPTVNGKAGETVKLTTDDLGIAAYTFTPGKDPVQLNVTAADAGGRMGRARRDLNLAGGAGAILLQIDRPLAKVGDRLTATALSPSKTGTVYFDIIRDGQTIQTAAQDLHNGRATLLMPLTPDMAGTLRVRAYKILPNEDIIRDVRTVLVSPADDLTIKITADKAMYEPGQEARLLFDVTDARRRPVATAIGLAVVDESVFALSEMQPGLEKIYFTLERELMEPKYEIHGLKPSGLLMPAGIVMRNDPARQRAAQLLLAAAPAPPDFSLRVNTYTTRFAALRVKAEEIIRADCARIVNAVQKYKKDTGDDLNADQSLQVLVDKKYLAQKDLLDPWGGYYKSNLFGSKVYVAYMALNSAGPDGKWDTNDDIAGVGQMTRFRFGRGGRAGAQQRAGNGAMVFENAQAEAPMMMEDAAGVAGPAGAVPMMAFARLAAPMSKSGGGISTSPDAANAGPRVRSYFPETMYWNPALLTDDNGRAELSMPLADNITTWRLSASANSAAGQLGSITQPIKVFQDFFVDLDLPVSLTEHDRFSLPVAVYNYLPQAQTITLKLKQDPWFTLQGDPDVTLHVAAGQVTVAHFDITAKSVGLHELTVTAQGSRASDAIRRHIDVSPDGRLVENVINDRLERNAAQTVSFPAQAVEGGKAIWVKIYPGAFSQVAEGLDGLLQMPSGCFEQTSSTTYPNVLVLDYLKQTKRVNPELQMKADGYINVGYQRLVTFETKTGGFSWFGDEPAHQSLTAYGLLEFSDMAKVHEVDPALITRTQAWLAGKQAPEGSWEEKNQGIAEGIINRQTGALRTTAYIAWSLSESGYKGPEVTNGIAYVKKHLDEAKDPYTLAVILNLLTLTEREGNVTSDIAGRLVDMAKTTDKTAYWQSDTKTFTGAVGEGADLETTGLAAYGLVKWGRNGSFVTKVLTYLVQSKNSFGTWSSTQGTVWSLKALLAAGKNGTGGKGTVTVLANGQKAADFRLTEENSDVMRQVNLAEYLKPDENKVTLQYDGDGSLLYQVAGRWYMPWEGIGPKSPEAPALSLNVAYDKTTLATDDIATVTVTLKNTTNMIAEMPLVDLGVPPGFTVIPDELQKAVDAKQISKFTLAARQIIVYMEKLDAGQELTLHYALKARFPIKAKTPLSKAYPYYNPLRVAVSAPLELEVR